MIVPNKRKRGEGIPASMRWLILSLLLVAFGAPLLIGGFVAGVYVASDGLGSEVYHSGEQAEQLISQRFHAVPDETFYTHYYEYAWQESLLQVRFSAPAADVEAWVNALTICERWDHDTDAMLVYHSANLDWWRPTSAWDYTVASCASDPQFRMLVDQSDSAVWTVYIQEFRM